MRTTLKAVLIIIILIIANSSVLEEHKKKQEILAENAYTEVSLPNIHEIFIHAFGNESIHEIISHYQELYPTIVKGNISIPIDGNYVPQGITEMKNYLLITAYDSTKKNNSKVYVITKEGTYINEVTLDTNAHVGGIAFDEVNNLLWIPGNNGTLLAYNAPSFLTQENVQFHSEFLNLSKGMQDFKNTFQKAIDYLCIEGEYLYIGNFTLNEPGTIKKFHLRKNNQEIQMKEINSFQVPPKVQGITFYELHDQKYMLLSTSYSRYNTSNLMIFSYNENQTEYKETDKNLECPPMLEQIIKEGNNLYLLFESAAKKYNNCPEIIEYICIIDIKELIYSYGNNKMA